MAILGGEIGQLLAVGWWSYQIAALHKYAIVCGNSKNGIREAFLVGLKYGLPVRQR